MPRGDRGSWIDPAGSATTFESWARRWLELGVAKSLGTRATDESILRAALLPVFGTRTIGSIRPLDVQDVVVRWSRVAKPRTVRRRYATLSAILNSAVDMDLLARSPCRGIQLPRWSLQASASSNQLRSRVSRPSFPSSTDRCST